MSVSKTAVVTDFLTYERQVLNPLRAVRSLALSREVASCIGRISKRLNYPGSRSEAYETARAGPDFNSAGAQSTLRARQTVNVRRYFAGMGAAVCHCWNDWRGC